jgi:hypothetical protein
VLVVLVVLVLVLALIHHTVFTRTYLADPTDPTVLEGLPPLDPPLLGLLGGYLQMEIATTRTTRRRRKRRRQVRKQQQQPSLKKPLPLALLVTFVIATMATTATTTIIIILLSWILRPYVSRSNRPLCSLNEQVHRYLKNKK